MMRGIIYFESKIIKISNSVLIKNDHDDLFIINTRYENDTFQRQMRTREEKKENFSFLTHSFFF
jgi:hypothetical protein